MAKARVKKQNYIFLNPDVIIFEPDYKRLHEPEAFAPGGIDFYGSKNAETGQLTGTAERMPSAVSDALETLAGKFNRPGGIVDKFATSILKIDDLVEGHLDSFIDVLETGVANSEKKNEKRGRSLERVYYTFKNFLNRHKKESIAISAVAVCCIFALTSFLDSMTVYEYSYYGYKLGYAQTKSEVYETIDLISSKIKDRTSAEVQFDKYNDVTFTKVVASEVSTDSQDEILDNFTYLRTLKGSGTVILVDGEREVLVESEETAKKVLVALTEQYKKNGNGIQNESAEFVEEITMEPIETEVLKLKNFDDAIEFMKTGGNGGTSLATVATSEIDTYDEVIPFETNYEDSAEVYEGETKVKTKGVEGKRSVTARVNKLNGEEVDRDELSKIIISEPVTQVILKGTKQRANNLSGKLIDPLPNQLLYKGFIVEYSNKYGVDPYLIMAIINTESHFNTEATSSQGARGLMQMTGSTGAWVAKAIGDTNYVSSDLYDPKTNIKMGCWYVNYLKKEFGSTGLVLAAYNAGPGNVNKWLRNATISADGQNLENIPFDETRNYIKKVMTDYKNFKLLYKI